MRKFFVLLFVVSFVLLVFVSAQLGNLENQIENASENLQDKLDKAKEIAQRDKGDFIGSQWKEFLLKNKLISEVNSFFINIDAVFVVLFSLHWAISVEMLFVFMLWLFTGLSMYGYLSIFKNNLLRWMASFLVAIMLAHVKFYYLVSRAMFKLIFFKQSKWWNLITFVVCILLFILYFKINKLVSEKFKKSRENSEKHETEFKLKKLEAFNKGIQIK